jgi:pimeloyl-ACP methyl ester carboxylesterase
MLVGSLLWWARPYSTDLCRYALWRYTQGRGFITGTVQSGDAHIAWRSIGPLDRSTSTVNQIPLVLLHGGLGSDLDWYAEVPALAQTHSLILIDTRGHGSSTLGTQTLSYTLFASDVIVVLNKLGLERVNIVGWSDGGNTGLFLARAYPERIHRLVAISVNAHPEGLLPRVRQALAQSGADRPILPRLRHALFSPEPGNWPLLAAGSTNLWLGYPQLHSTDLQSIHTPTLLIAGSQDDVQIGHLDEIAKAIPTSTLAVLPGISHTVPQSAPHEVLRLIAGFIQE